MRNSILKRTFRYFLVSMCAIILVFSVFMLNYLNQQYKEKYASTQVYVTEKTAESVNELLMNIKQRAYYMCCNEALAEALLNDAGTDKITQRKLLSDAFVMNTGIPAATMLQSAYEIFFVDTQFDYSTEGALFDMKTAFGTGRKRVYSARDVKEEAWFRETMDYDAQIYAFTSEEAPEHVLFAHRLRNIHLINPNYSDSAGVVLYSTPVDTVVSILRNDQMAGDTVSLVLFNDQILASTHEELFPVGGTEKTAKVLAELPDAGEVKRTQYEGSTYEISSMRLSNRWRVVVMMPKVGMAQSVMQMLPLLAPLVLALVAASLLISIMFSRRLSAPIRQLSDAMIRARKAQEMPQTIGVVHTGDEIETLYHSYNDIVENIHRISELEKEQNAKLKKSELKALQSQINPHFVYNTLDSVACIALINGEDDIATMVASLINILKYSIRFSSMQVSLREELDYLQQYIQIQTLRYRERFRFECDIPEEYGNVKVPKLLIQPLVENALFYAENELLVIRVYCEARGDRFCIHVCDNGSGADVEMLNERLKLSPTGEKYGIGIGNVNKRIQLVAGEEYGIHYARLEDGGLDAMIVLPYEMMDF